MAKIQPTNATVNGHRIHAIPGAPVRVTIKRGWDWAVVKVLLGENRPEDKALLKTGSEVTIKIECAARNSTGTDTIELKGWWVVSRRVREKGFVEYELADVRWRRNHAKLTKQYNIRSYGGSYRPVSVRGGFTAWKAYDAVVDALNACGYRHEENPKLAGHLRGITLPDNLSNAEGGGWAAAPQAVWGPAMADPIAVDPVPTQGGGIMLADRTTEVSKDTIFAGDYLQFSGHVGAANIEWQLPRKIRVPFAKRIERRAHFSESATVASNDYDIQLEEVIPDWTPGGSLAVRNHTELSAYVAANFLPRSTILKRFIRKQMFDLHGNLTAQQLDNYGVIQEMVRQCLRKRYRFKRAQADVNDVRARYAMVQLGRVQADGTTRKDGVYLPYIKDLRFGKLKNADDNPLTAVFSSNVDLSLTDPAPYTAEWLNQDDLIFELVANSPSAREIVGYVPGAFTSPKSYGDIHQVIAGKQPLQLSTQSELSSSFNLYVYWSGLWVHDGPGDGFAGPGDLSRLRFIELPLFQSGKVDVLTHTLVPEMTANFRYRESDGAFPGDALNHDEVVARAKQIRDEVKESFTQRRAGISYHAGIDVITRGQAWVNGDIHELSIELNGRAPGSVETHITVLPGRRVKPEPVLTGPRQAGKLPERFL